MAQSLLESHGAQPEKPTKFKSIWNDRFFTGMYTNRSPFRSPMSILYADGWNLGRTDTILDGVNVEVSPRLTLARRPGTTEFCTQPSAQIPLTFYSFHTPQGNITVVEDTATNVNIVTPTAITSIYTKPVNSNQSAFCSLGPNLYWGDGTVAQCYETETLTERQLGINTPTKAVGVSELLGNPGDLLRGSNYVLTGVSFGSTGYISTTTQLSNYSAWTFEGWVQGTAGPIASFESAQTGASPAVYYTVFLDSTGQLCVNVSDQFLTINLVESGFVINDAEWHHICVTFDFTSSIGNKTPQATGATQNSNPDNLVTSNFNYLNSPTLSSQAAPSLMEVNFFIDGTLVNEINPPIYTIATGTGYWRFGGASRFSVSLNGKMSEISVAGQANPGPADHFITLNLDTAANVIVDNSVYQTRIVSSNFQFFWLLQEAAGTVATEVISGNTGTYNTCTLLQTQTMRYRIYSASTAYGFNQVIVDPNGNLQAVIVAGTSGSSAPTWLTQFQQLTGDGSITWECLGPASFDASTAQYLYYYSYINAQGHYSSLSPVSLPTGWANAQIPNLIGPSSTDPQVVAIGIFRTVAGGSTPFLDKVIPHPSRSIPAWGYLDDVTDAELNILLSGPQANSNNPPAYGMTNLVYHMSRVWGSVGNLLYASGGPDTLVGNGNEAWPPANSWSYPAPVIRLIPNSQGLLVCTTSGIFLHAGGPSIAQFYPQPLYPNIGLSSFNALDVKGNEVVLFTSDKRLLGCDLTSNTLTDLGYPIQDKLANFDPTKVYVVRHHRGLDNAVYIGDGSTGWYRCVPQQAPDFTLTGPVWSPFSTIVFPVDPGGIIGEPLPWIESQATAVMSGTITRTGVTSTSPDSTGTWSV